MARHEERTFGKVTLAKERLAGEVSIEKIQIVSGNAGLKINSAQAVASTTPTADAVLRVNINGAEYDILLQAV